MEFFLVPDQPVTKFVSLNAKHFQDGDTYQSANMLASVDIASEETQLKIIQFYDRMDRCYLCDENWNN